MALAMQIVMVNKALIIALLNNTTYLFIQQIHVEHISKYM